MVCGTEFEWRNAHVNNPGDLMNTIDFFDLTSGVLSHTDICTVGNCTLTITVFFQCRWSEAAKAAQGQFHTENSQNPKNSTLSYHQKGSMAQGF